MKMTVELFDSIINTSQDCVFWKDKDRRFLGVNQAFLDFYGFDSQDVLIGKNDEDMGWHSDPEPYKRDELEVLSGKSTYKVQGKCIIRGEERDIVASKRPLYEGDEIVGLVGSFVDITDVIRRKNALDAENRVYDIDDLRQFPFFDRILEEISLDEILDPLTGILSRAYSVKFVHSLITENIPFTFTMIDLDNFKQINDTYGHSAGDKVLVTVGKGLAKQVKGFGLAGRFGGDELLLIDLKNTELSQKEEFYEKLYAHSNALRIKVRFDNGGAYVTGTVGAASFPEDADNFTDLFGLIDKMLYLGKNRGRNCYTIYEADKHRNIEIVKIVKNGIYTYMNNIRRITEDEAGFTNKLKSVITVLAELLQAQDLYYVGHDGRMRSVTEPDFDEDASDIDALMKEDVFSESTLNKVKKNAPILYGTLMNNGYESVLITKIRKKNDVRGYILCPVRRSMRIWQEDECAIMYYLAELLSDYEIE